MYVLCTFCIESPLSGWCGIVFKKRCNLWLPKKYRDNCEFSIAERHVRMHTEAAGTVNNIQLPPQSRLNKSLGQAMPGHARPKSEFAVTFVSLIFFNTIFCSPRNFQASFLRYKISSTLREHDNAKDFSIFFYKSVYTNSKTFRINSCYQRYSFT